MFTRQHYKAIAKILAEHVGLERWVDDEDGLDMLNDLVRDFCTLFEADNPSFKPESFIEACQNRE